MRHRERAEEGLLALIGMLLLALLYPTGFGTRILVSGVIAVALILLLILRSADWHAGGATPFDGILLAGVAVSVAHLLSIVVANPTTLGRVLLGAAAVYYATMAALLAHHRGWLFRETM